MPKQTHTHTHTHIYIYIYIYIYAYSWVKLSVLLRDTSTTVVARIRTHILTTRLSEHKSDALNRSAITPHARYYSNRQYTSADVIVSRLIRLINRIFVKPSFCVTEAAKLQQLLFSRGMIGENDPQLNKWINVSLVN